MEKQAFLSQLQKSGYAEHGPFKVEKIQENVFHMDTATKDSPAGSIDQEGNFNNPSSIYFIKHEIGTVIIDLANPLENGSLAELSAQFIMESLCEDKPVSIIFTHGHFDHTGLATSNTIFSHIKIDQMYLPQGDEEMSQEALINHKDHLTIISDSSLDLYGGHYETIKVGGHTPGSIFIANEEKELLFTGDTFGSGYVWMFWDTMGDSDPLYALELGCRKVYEISSKMEHPVILAGHRWQQFIDTNPQRPNEMTSQYFLDMILVLHGLLDGTTKEEPYPAAAHLGENPIEISHPDAHAKIDTLPVFVQNYQMRHSE